MAYLKNFQHDVFISYAHNDNSGGWVKAFKNQLNDVLIEHLGSKDVKIFFDDQLQSNHPLDRFVKAAGQSALFLALASPSYVNSAATKAEYQAFVTSNVTEDCLFTIELLPLSDDDFTSYPKIAQQIRTRFYQPIAHEVAQKLPANTEAINKQINILAAHICQQLKAMAKPVSKPVSKPTSNTTYVPNCQYDVVISHTAEDAAWAQQLLADLSKQLTQKLGTIDGFRLLATADTDPLKEAASLVIVGSPPSFNDSDYVEKIAHHKDQPLFLALSTDGALPAPLLGLKNLTRIRFWDYNQTGQPDLLRDDAYFAATEKLATALSSQLKDIKLQQEHWLKQEQERLKQQQTRSQPSVDAFVFLHSAQEDIPLRLEIVALLQQQAIDYILPIEHNPHITPSDIRLDVENNIVNCDAILLIYEQSNPVWVREQLSICRRIQRKRETPLKIIAVHKAHDKPSLDVQLSNLTIYDCPPEHIDSYLQKFIAALV
ncbi:MAG: toll/interleukin-1 receptor domain-containing protein [Methylococcales bacterium]|nr:toll/interleukin-1 receptor domain-containing protein [Methylococcales bacterium]